MTALTKDPSEIYQYLLIARSLATLPSNDLAFPVYPRREPNKPDDCITVYDTDPTLLGSDMISGYEETQYGLQIRIRTRSPSVNKAWTIVRSLSKVNKQEVTIGYTSFVVNRCHLISGPISLGTSVSPQSGLYLFTINYSSQIKELP